MPSFRRELICNIKIFTAAGHMKLWKWKTTVRLKFFTIKLTWNTTILQCKIYTDFAMWNIHSFCIVKCKQILQCEIYTDFAMWNVHRFCNVKYTQILQCEIYTEFAMWNVHRFCNVKCTQTRFRKLFPLSTYKVKISYLQI